MLIFFRNTTFLIVFFFGTAFAQKVTSQWSVATPFNPFRESVTNVLQGDNSGIYILKNVYSGGLLNRKVTPILQKFDDKMNLAFTQDYSLSTTDDSKYALDEFVYMKKGFLMFTSKYERSSRTQTVYGIAIAPNGKVDGKPKSLLSYDFEQRADRANINITTSEDTTKALVYFEVERYEKAEKDKLAFGVYDYNLNEIWSKSIVMPYSARKLDIINCSVDNNGDVFVLCKLYEQEMRQETKRRDDGKRESGFKYVLLQYNATEKIPKEYEISLPKKQIVNLKYKLTSKNEVVVAGFYADETSKARGIVGALGGQGLTGIFYALIDGNTKQTKAVSLKPFDTNFEQELKQRNGTLKTKDGGLAVSPYFEPRKFILRDDGGLVIISEFINVYTVQTRDANGIIHTTTYYNYLDLIVTSVSPKGDIEWSSVIPKYQTSVNDGGYQSSYSLMVHDSKLHFIFNDNPRNFEQNSRGFYNISRNPQRNVVAIASVDAAGSVTKKILFSNKDKKSYLQPNRGKQINANEMVIYSSKNASRFLGIKLSSDTYSLCKLRFE